MVVALGFAVITLAAVTFYLLRRVEVERRERRLAEALLRDARETARTSYATGREHGLDEGYKRSEQQRATDRRKKLAQEQGRRIHLN